MPFRKKSDSSSLAIFSGSSTLGCIVRGSEITMLWDLLFHVYCSIVHIAIVGNSGGIHPQVNGHRNCCVSYTAKTT